jgi:hypothetical protein
MTAAEESPGSGGAAVAVLEDIVVVEGSMVFAEAGMDVDKAMSEGTDAVEAEMPGAMVPVDDSTAVSARAG